jgi:dipeptidyl aminopeptidase/acylaminoacyl peptidase
MVRIAALLLAFSLPALAQPPVLIPRDALLGNPERLKPLISPDGSKLSYLAPDEKNVLQIWVRPLAGGDAAVVTADKKRGIRQYQWAEDSKTLLYLQDNDGDENFHVYALDLDSKNERDLTPFKNVKAGIVDTHPRFPDTVLVSLNLRDRKVFDVHKVSLKTGAVEVDTLNTGDVTQWLTDSNFQVRAAYAQLSDGSTEIRVRDTVKSAWRSLIKSGPDETLALYGFTFDNKSLFLGTTIGTDTQRVVEKNLKTGSEHVMAKSDTSDPTNVMVHPNKFEVHGVAFDVNGKNEWTVLDSSLREALAAMKAQAEGEVDVVSRDNADAFWVLSLSQDKAPVSYWLYEKAAKRATLLFSSQPKLAGAPLVDVRPVAFPARDGLNLNAYVTVPVEPKGLVLLVHGGPWARDSWGYSGLVQLLANRGYAVLQVNYRGSSGYGKRFLNAGNKQWGLSMQNDLLDAVAYTTQAVTLDPKKVCIMGGSYGGYAALYGAAFNGDVFRCSVDLVGPSNIATLLRTTPPYWAAMKGMLSRRVGDLDVPLEVEALRKVSPLFVADRIATPLLIGQGANDPRVKQAESEQIVAAMEKAGRPVTYVLYPDEGHGLARPENRIDFFARAEGFFAKVLGGRFEPLPADGKVPGSSGVVKVVKGNPQAAR